MIAESTAVPHQSALHHSLAVGSPPPVVLRHGTLADLDSILDIGLAAMPMDPQWDFRFPYRRTYPQDERDATRNRYREFLENDDGRWLVVVAEMAAVDELRPVAFAVWDLYNLSGALIRHPRTTSTCKSPKNTRRDGNQNRMRAWNSALQEAKKRNFDCRFGAQHIQLQILATHPDFQKLGAGTLLVSDGIRLAEAFGKAIAVFASPLGKRLYRNLGFNMIETVIVRAKEEAEFVSVEAMAYEPHDWQRDVSEPVKMEGVCASGMLEASIWGSGAKRVRATSVHLLAAVPKWKSAML